MTQETATPKTDLSEAEFKLTKEFCSLTPRQRVFVLRYLQDRDALAAVKVAYPDSKAANTQKNSLLRHPNVLEAIHRWYGTPTRDVAIENIKREIRRCRSARVRMELNELLFKLQGLIQ